MSNQANPDVFVCADAATAGLWALVTHALRQDGQGAALVAMDQVTAGRAHVECSAVFTKRGVALDGKFCSHGTSSHLFSVTLNSQDALQTDPKTIQ